MNTEFLYLVAEQLYLNAAQHPMSNRLWLPAIYKSLLASNRGDQEDILWTKYNQWKIDHNCRASRSNAKTNQSKIISFDIQDQGMEKNLIKVIIEKKMKIIDIQVKYRREDFPKGLWEFKNPKNKSVLSSFLEADALYDASVYESNQDAELSSSFDPKENDSLKPKVLNISLYSDLDGGDLEYETQVAQALVKTKSNPALEHGREMKFQALKSLLDQVRDSFHQNEDFHQKSYLLTVIAAAIFYLPSLHFHFSGYISVAALKGYLKGQRRVKDHIFPRKQAAKELLKREYSLEKLKEKYHNELAKYMYVTPTENSQLINFYEDHVDYKIAIEALQIEEFPSSGVARFSSHRELDQFLVFLSTKEVNKMSKEELNQLLLEFRMSKSLI
jgi:hypothetical protein